MTVEITLTEWELKEIIKKYLQTKGYKLSDGYDQRDTGNYTIAIEGKQVKIRITE